MPGLIAGAQATSCRRLRQVCEIGLFGGGRPGSCTLAWVHRRKNPMAAVGAAAELVARVENLCLSPEIGRNVELAPTSGAIRDFVFGSYMVRYALHTSAVVILRIWHHYESRE